MSVYGHIWYMRQLRENARKSGHFPTNGPPVLPLIYVAGRHGKKLHWPHCSRRSTSPFNIVPVDLDVPLARSVVRPVRLRGADITIIHVDIFADNSYIEGPQDGAWDPNTNIHLLLAI